MKYNVSTTTKDVPFNHHHYDTLVAARVAFFGFIDTGIYESVRLYDEENIWPIESWEQDMLAKEKRMRLERDGEYFYDEVAKKFIEPSDVGQTKVEHKKR